MQEMIRTYANEDGTARERLAAAIDRWTRLNLSVHELFTRAAMPVPYKTFLRWLSGQQEPGAYRLDKTLEAIRRETAREEARLRGLLDGEAA